MVNKKKKSVKKSKKKKSDKVCEIFEVDGKEKKVCGEMPSKPVTKKQILSENKLLRNLFIGIGIFIILLLLGVWFINSIKYFKYEGMEFKVIKEGNLIFYNTAFPIFSNKVHIADYNVYLNKDPRKSKEVEFNVERINWKPFIIMNSTEPFSCDGDGIISIANLAQVLDTQGIKIVKNENISCNSAGENLYILLKSGEKNEIRQTNQNCYEFIINDCEILEVTERFLLEIVIDINKRVYG